MNSDFLDLLRAFVGANVKFLIVGAHALAIHGRPRATGDLDVWVEPTVENAQRVLAALRMFGAPLASLSELDLATPGIIFQMGQPPRRIDILTELTGVTFDEAWGDRVSYVVDEIELPFIGRLAFIKNKRATGRAKDLGDIEALGE
jgi:hypothetical protein